MQTTFAEWLKAQIETELDRVLADLQREADEDQRCLDYEEEEHEVRQAACSSEYADDCWAPAGVAA